MNRRERERRALRQSILNAAQELFTDHGFGAVSMRSIAKKVEYSQSVIYQHFADKRSLITELCAVNFRKMGEQFARAASIEAPLERLVAIGRIYVAFAKENPNHYQMMFMTAHPPVAVQDRSIPKGDPMQDAWALMVETLRDAQQRGVLSSEEAGPEQLAHLFFAGVHGVVSLHIAKGNDPWIEWGDIDEISEMMIQTLVRGQAPRPKATP